MYKNIFKKVNTTFSLRRVYIRVFQVLLYTINDRQPWYKDINQKFRPLEIEADQDHKFSLLIDKCGASTYSAENNPISHLV